MTTTYGSHPFGLNDVKLTEIDGSPQVDLPAARTLSFSERIASSELKGDDQLVAVLSVAEAVEWSLEAGGISLDAYALMTGRTVTISGTTPAQSSYLDIDGARCYPYFKIYGKAIDDDCASDIHVKIRKAKLTAIEGELANGEFLVTKAEGVAISDGVAIVSFIQNETAAALAAS